MSVFASDPTKTAARMAVLDDYFQTHVLDGPRFVCSRAEQCRGSHRGAFYEGQAHHVGRHFDLSIDGFPIRIVVTGQEYGGPPQHVLREMRTATIVQRTGIEKHFVRDGQHPARNPHMRGTTSLLRLLLGRGLGTDHDGEFLSIDGTVIHLFECFALVNFLLCSAVDANPSGAESEARSSGMRGRSTSVMQDNCALHYRRAIEILCPTIVVAQGVGVGRWLAHAVDQRRRVESNFPIELASVGSNEFLLVTFAHPSAPNRSNWGMNARQPYLLDVVAPTVRRLRDIALAKN